MLTSFCIIWRVWFHVHDRSLILAATSLLLKTLTPKPRANREARMKPMRYLTTTQVHTYTPTLPSHTPSRTHTCITCTNHTNSELTPLVYSLYCVCAVTPQQSLLLNADPEQECYDGEEYSDILPSLLQLVQEASSLSFSNTTLPLELSFVI